MNTTSDPQSSCLRVRRTVALVTAIAAALMLTPIMIRPAGASPAGYAGFPGKNGLIAFDAGNDVWVMNPDGTDRRNLTSTPGQARILADVVAARYPYRLCWRTPTGGCLRAA